MSEKETPVLIVGGGLSGLTEAVLLHRFGVPAVLIERRSGMIAHPRARILNPRSVEIYQQAGLLEQVLAKRNHTEHAENVLFRAETLAAPERFRFPLAHLARAEAVSPQPWAAVDQDTLETVLSDYLVSAGADVRYGVELVSFTQDENGVRAVLADHGRATEEVLCARYLVAADGGRSRTRDLAGIGVHGQGAIGHTLTFVFEADLTEPLRGRRLGVGHLDRPVPGTVLLSYDQRKRWVLYVPVQPERVRDFDDEYCVEMVRTAIGIPDLPVSILPQLADGTKVLNYDVAAQVADRFQAGRVLVIGDAAHLMPQTGAFGAGTGIADAHNLAWKLAAVVNGQADPALLDSYDAERRPVADLTVEQALLRLRERTDAAPPGESTPVERESTLAERESRLAELDYYATVLGYRYQSTATVDTDDQLPVALEPGRLTGQPGTRAPHIRLAGDNGTASTLDLFGDGFVVLTGAQGQHWCVAAREVAAELDVAVAAYRIGTDVVDVENKWPSTYQVGDDGAVLVRPDGFVAWRAASAVADRHRTLVENALRLVLGRPGE